MKQLENLKYDQSVDYYFNLGELYFLAHNYSKAYDYLRKYIGLAGDNAKLILKSKEYLNQIPMDTTVKTKIFIEEPLEYVDEPIYESHLCETKPNYKGSDTAIINYIERNISYPIIAKENNIAGVVYVKFVVLKNGKILNVSTLRTVDPLLDEEAIRIVKSFPHWTPATIDEKPVNCWFIIPVKFKL